MLRSKNWKMEADGQAGLRVDVIRMEREEIGQAILLCSFH